jgi:RND family efflux transporter MFP subunit
VSELKKHTARPRPSPALLRISGIVLVIVLLTVAGLGLSNRFAANADLEKTTERQAIASVQTVTVAQGPVSEELILPGTVQAQFEAPIYARTSGYIKAWYTDIGAHVTKGQLLAEIDSPEVDDQLRQAEADLATAQANEQLARTTAERWRILLSTDSVSKQDNDEKAADAAAKGAAVRAAQANVARLRQQKEFARVVAPFDGVVTARRIDVGALINAGSGVGPQLFNVADNTKLRIYVQVPQTYAPKVGIDMKAELVFSQYPGKRFPAVLVRTADAIDPAARTLLVELQTDNANNQLLPGGYAEVHMALPTQAQTVRVPVNTLLFRSEGLRVAKLGPDDKVQLVPITMGRDYGSEVEVLVGIMPGDKIVLNPPDSLGDGQQVRVVQPPPAPGSGPSGQNQGSSAARTAN